ncbi:hypothetical protein BU17DRAFT_88720 [Hysterangium stoloniferum]|nr:hypothetical protein BU17DRAFT_88720 [Hysterangium stoloniferum]
MTRRSVDGVYFIISLLGSKSMYVGLFSLISLTVHLSIYSTVGMEVAFASAYGRLIVYRFADLLHSLSPRFPLGRFKEFSRAIDHIVL